MDDETEADGRRRDAPKGCPRCGRIYGTPHDRGCPLGPKDAAPAEAEEDNAAVRAHRTDEAPSAREPKPASQRPSAQNQKWAHLRPSAQNREEAPCPPSSRSRCRCTVDAATPDDVVLTKLDETEVDETEADGRRRLDAKSSATRTVRCGAEVRELRDELTEAAHVTCEQLRVFYGRPAFIHLPEDCAGCRLIRDRMQRAYELGLENG